ncbi:hypothetical protein [Streptomyces lydicus]|uniref:hypothetical protein n=1 Tax=Streptomyces lydicus TaxID=47763 RepID=UPI0036E6143B
MWHLYRPGESHGHIVGEAEGHTAGPPVVDEALQGTSHHAFHEGTSTTTEAISKPQAAEDTPESHGDQSHNASLSTRTAEGGHHTSADGSLSTPPLDAAYREHPATAHSAEDPTHSDTASAIAQTYRIPEGFRHSGEFGLGGRIHNLDEVVQTLHRGVVGALKEPLGNEGLSQALRVAVERERAWSGHEEWGRSLVHGGVEFPVTTETGHNYLVHAQIGLADRAHATNLPAERFETSDGKHVERSQPFDPPSNTEVARTRNRSRGVGGNIPLKVYFPASEPHVSLSAGPVIGGSTNRTAGTTEVSVTQGLRSVASGNSVYFSLPGNELTVTVRADDRSVARSNPLPLDLVLAFPAGAAPRVATHESGHGAWVVEERVAGDEIGLVGAAPPEGWDPRVRQRLDEAFWQGYTDPESIGNIEGLRQLVLDKLPSAAVQPGSVTDKHLRLFLSERSQMREFLQLAGSGHTSEPFQIGDSTLHLTVRTRLLSAQRLGPADVHTKLWNEQRSYLMDNQTHTLSHTAKITAEASASYTRNPKADFGRTHGFTATLGGTVADTIAQSAGFTQGGSRWQNLLHEGPTVAFRLRMEHSAELLSDRAGVEGVVHTDGTVHVRVPVGSAERFEEAVRQAVAPTTEQVGHHTLNSVSAERIPPAIRNGTGVGPAYVQITGVASGTMPDTILQLVHGVKPSFKPLELALLRRQLAADFSSTALNAQVDQLLSGTGMRKPVLLPDGGTAHVVITPMDRTPAPVRGGRHDDRQMNIVSSVMHGADSSDTVSRSFSAGLSINSSLGLRENAVGRVNNGYTYRRNHDRGLTTGDFLFAAPGGVLFPGPTYWFEYGMSLGVRVAVEPAPLGKSLLRRTVQGVKQVVDAMEHPAGRPAPRGAEEPPRDRLLPPTATVVSKRLDGVRARYWVPEDMLHPDAPISASLTDDLRLGDATVHEGPARPWRRDRERVRLTADDMPLPPIVPPELSQAVRELVRRSGWLSDARAEALVDTVTQQRRMTGLFQYGLDSGITRPETVHLPGALINRAITVRISGELLDSRFEVPGTVRAGRLVLAEITPKLVATDRRGTSHAVSFGIGGGARTADRHHPDRTQMFWPSIGVGWTASRGSSREVLERSTTGGLHIDAPAEYRRQWADIAYTVEVERWAGGPIGRTQPVREVQHVIVRGGLELLRRVPSAEPVPAEVPRQLASDAIPQFSIPRGLQFPSREGDPAGHNPLVHQAEELLRLHVPASRRGEASLRWTVDGVTALPLDVLFSPQSLLGAHDTLLSTGLTVRPFLPHVGHYLQVHATRRGDYAYEQSHPQGLMGKYANRDNWTTAATTKTPGAFSVNAGFAPQHYGANRHIDSARETGSGAGEQARDKTFTRTERQSHHDLIKFTGTHSYLGPLELTLSLRRVATPTPLMWNRLFLGLPDRLRSAYYRADAPPLRAGRGLIVTETVTVPDSVLDIRNTSPLAVTPAHEGPSLQEPKDLLAVTTEDVRQGRVVITGFRHTAARELHDRFLQGLRHSDHTSTNGAGIGRALAELGRVSEDALRKSFSYSMLIGSLDRALAPGGHTFPLLIRDSSLGHLRGSLTLRVSLPNPQVLREVTVGHNLERSHRTQQSSSAGIGTSFSVSIGAGLALHTGDPKAKEHSPTAQVLPLIPSIDVSRGNWQGVSATSQMLRGSGGVFRHRPEATYWHVRSGADYTAILAMDGEKPLVQHISLGPGTVEFLIDPAHAVEQLGLRRSPSLHPESHGTNEGDQEVDSPVPADGPPNQLGADRDRSGPPSGAEPDAPTGQPWPKAVDHAPEGQTHDINISAAHVEKMWGKFTPQQAEEALSHARGLMAAHGVTAPGPLQLRQIAYVLHQHGAPVAQALAGQFGPRGFANDATDPAARGRMHDSIVSALAPDSPVPPHQEPGPPPGRHPR